MARGWESKSVEAQQDEATQQSSAPKPRLTPPQAARKREIESLGLSRQRVVQQLASACDPRYRGMLEAALASLDDQLRKLESA
jgi:hypothetical protein